MLGRVVEDHPDGSFTHLWRMLTGSSHWPILSLNGIPTNPVRFTSIDDTIMSVDRIQVDLGQLHARPFFGLSAVAWTRLKGRAFSILLPFIIDGKTDNVLVTFLVEDVDL